MTHSLLVRKVVAEGTRSSCHGPLFVRAVHFVITQVDMPARANAAQIIQKTLSLVKGTRDHDQDGECDQGKAECRKHVQKR